MSGNGPIEMPSIIIAYTNTPLLTFAIYVCIFLKIYYLYHMVLIVIKITRNTHCAERLARQDMYAVCMLCVASRKVKYYNLNLLCA